MKISIELPTSPTSGVRHAPLSEPADPLDVVGHALGAAAEKIVPNGSGTIPPLRLGSSRVTDFSGRS
ncbi:hypothetical protein ACLMAL_31805 [Nocardia sp. CWNU-33]|uniref:hypothetical protein n=1 Tax=Nocardia sp. CWNU-33 TaxID=3392117 RepID=UPI00398EE430